MKPTLFIGVPRVFDKVFDGVQARLKQAPLRKRLIFALALWYKWRNIKAGYRWDEVRTVQWLGGVLEVDIGHFVMVWLGV